jgi:chorismate mutase
MSDLTKLRTQIDSADKKLISTLAERMDIVRKVGKYKKLKNLPPLDDSRWHEVLEDRKQIAKKLNLPDDLIEDIWNRIHKYSLELE